MQAINTTLNINFSFIWIGTLQYIHLTRVITRACVLLSFLCPCCFVVTMLVGTLSKDDDDASETVGKKWICVLSNLIASIWTRSICQILATFPGVEFLKGFYLGSKRGREIRHRMSTFSIKRQMRKLHVIVVQWTSKNVLIIKSVMHLQSCCFDH